MHCKKKLLAASLLLSLSVLTITGCGSKSKETASPGEKIVLNEVAHSIFYAPMYVAVEEGYFNEEGIDLEIVTGFGADKTMTAVLSGEADIGFMGPETTVYAFNEGASDVVKNFAQLTQRAGNFLISREPIEDFKWSDIKGKTVLGGRAGGMPEMVFEFVLKKNNIDPAADLSIDQSIDFGSTAAAFSGGQADFTVEFEPSATALEKEGAGYVAASVGVDSGYVPYTAFSAKESYLIGHPDIIQSFVNALQKGMDYVSEHTSEEIAAVIAPQFTDTDKETIATIVSRYQEQDTWKNDVIFTEDAYTLLLDILEESDQLSARPEYENLVNTKFAAEAADK
ncbi:MAG: ABC transporter substrate-binding protein [Lachnospiraceae bacterium]|nr:ABC transporter substrate-binding protein [Lachnospiraceae bacterium]